MPGRFACVQNLVLPFDMKFSARTGHAEVVKLSGVFAAHCSCLASIEVGV